MGQIGNWTHREVRVYCLNGQPTLPPQTPYPNQPYWATYLNHLLLPSLIRPQLYKEYFGLDLNQFYQFRDRYVVPALTNTHMTPYLATADSVAVLFLIKQRKDIDYVSLQLFFGDVGDGTLERWYHAVLRFIYAQGALLQRLRHLSNIPNMTRILDDLHEATAANSRCYTVFGRMLRRYMIQNPHLGEVKLCVCAWDTRHIPIPHSSCFSHQSRLFSTKIHNNAIVKLVGAGTSYSTENSNIGSPP